MSDRAEIFEVGPRDGLQNEPRTIPVAEKIAFVDLLSRAGFRRIEVGSFVSRRAVPQMADSAEVFAGIARAPGVSYAALTPNLRGFEAAIAAGADEVAVFASASEGFSRANLGATIAESLDRYAAVTQTARAVGVPVRGYVSCVAVCPYDGPTDPADVARVARALVDLGCYEISLGDTVGQATPEQVQAMLEAVLEDIPPGQLAGHFHDTAGRALENVEVAAGLGLRVFDAASGGLGGCPFAPGAKGNVATEKLMARLAGIGFSTGLDREVVAAAADMARRIVGRTGTA